MNTVIIYNSKTGFTKQYAHWMSETIGCPAKSLSEVSEDTLRTYDNVIYGGWVMGGMITGFEKLKEKQNVAAVFAVGATPAYEEVISAIKEQNKLGDIPLFYLQGGMQFDKLGLFQRGMLKMLKKMVTKKDNRTRQDEFMAEALGTSFDHSSKEQIKSLVDWYQAM